MSNSEYTRLVPIPRGINSNINPCGNKFMLEMLGNPRNSYGSDCREVTNPKLAPQIVIENVGRFRVRGWKPAIDSLHVIMAEIKDDYPEVYAGLGTAGMLCARLVRGSKSAISNHSWGCAIDLTLFGELDARGNNVVQYGLTLIAPIFNKHGWYWGAGFRTEDAMHFEVGRSRLLEMLNKPVTEIDIGSPKVFDRGDRHPKIAELQKAIGVHPADGIFGPATETAIEKFQASKGLKPDGIAGPKTFAAAGIMV